MIPRVFAVICLAAVSGCNLNSALEEVVEARAISAELILQFAKASEASNRAVMANTDAGANAGAAETKAAGDVIDRDANRLRTLLGTLKFNEELGLLEGFTKRFTEYRGVQDNMVALAIEGTNLKAQRLSFGQAQESVDQLRDALSGVIGTGADRWRSEALSARTIAAVREIQVLEAPHIDEAGDQAMTQLESRMTQAEKTAREALAELATVVPAASKPGVANAVRQLDAFLTVHAEILALSRKNTNVRSLALALDRKRELAAACDADLRALQAALAKRGFVGTR
jgi:hypothetical protein